MKIESTFEEVLFEDWETPIMNFSKMNLLTALNAPSDNYFFFQQHGDEKAPIHVLHVEYLTPIRLTDKSYPYGQVFDKYLSPKNGQERPQSKTLKLWNTEFIIHIEGKSHELSGFALERNKSIYQCLIITEKEWIEFIPLHPPKWATHENKSLNELVLYYFEKSDNDEGEL